MNLLLLILALLTSSFYTIEDGDTFFHIKVGEYITKHGIGTKDPFSMHNLSYTPQQWLSDSIFYHIYNMFGYMGLVILLHIVLVMIILILYQINKLSGNKHKLSIISIYTSLALLNIFGFMVVRPQIFTYVLFLLQIYLLEKYLKTKRKRYLAFVPLVSLLTANFHIGTIPMVFILVLPYLVNSIFKIEKGKIYGDYHKQDFIWLLSTLFLSILTAFLNPYGIKKILYFTILFDANTQMIKEWQSPSFKGIQGVLIFLAFTLGILAFITSNKKISLKNLLMYFGLLFMSLYSLRYFPYFVLITQPIIVSILSQNNKIMNAKKSILTLNQKKLVKVVFIVLLAFLAIDKFNYDYKVVDLDGYPVNAVQYLKENTDYNNIRLYNEYIHGGYLMFNDIPVFIDSRQDLYLNSYNPGCNVFNDYINVVKGKKHYKVFLKQYDFEFFIVPKDSLLYTYITADPMYRRIVEDKESILFGIN